MALAYSVSKTSIQSNELPLLLHLFLAGEGRPVILFLHASGCHALMYRTLLSQLATAGYNIVAPDFQGHGENRGRRGHFTLQELVNNALDAARWACENLDDRIILVGTSMGGIVGFYALAQDAASDRPLIHSAVLHTIAGSPEDVQAYSRFPRFFLKIRSFFYVWIRVRDRIIPVRLRRRAPLRLRQFLEIERWRVMPIPFFLRSSGSIEATGRRRVVLGFQALVKWIRDRRKVLAFTLSSTERLVSEPPPAPIETIEVPIAMIILEKDRIIPDPEQFAKRVLSQTRAQWTVYRIPNAKHSAFHAGRDGQIDQIGRIVIDWADSTLEFGSR
ncbi:MAG: alpha/beta hydrolase [Candidatus Bipolaricaulia bacterium]